jgi:ATP-dependent RNA helicase DeaD
MSAAQQSSPSEGFASLGLSKALLTVLTGLGYEEPTPVQRETIPLMLAGRDLMAQAATGTGKTAAFALPMIQRLADAELRSAEPAPPDFREESAPPHPERVLAGPLSKTLAGAEDKRRRAKRALGIHEEPPRLVGRKVPAAAAHEAGPDRVPPRKAAKRGGSRGLVLVPTRELAMQVCEAIHKYARGTGITVVPLYGGSSMEQQIRALQRGVDIVVATPGRALDHIRRGTLALDAIGTVVLDEADEMLDMGFAEDIETLLEQTPDDRQTTLFSATMPPRILKIAERHLHQPERVRIAREKTAAGKMPRVRQVAYIVRRDQKARALDRILDMESPASAIVFCRTRLEVDTLVETLNAHGYRAEALHGGMVQRQRDAVMARVRSQRTDLLIATDVAARGLDIEHLSHVVNYDLPADAESYIHRIGRTGRAGREGTAISFAEPREHRLLKNIEYVTKQKIDIGTVPTVADLQSRRLELTKASLRERLVAADFDDARVVVESLSDEFDVVDIAAAAVKMLHAAAGGDGDDQEIPSAGHPRFQIPNSESRGADARSPRASRSARPRASRAAAHDGPIVRLFIGAGRRDGIRPGDIVGAITGEAGVPSDALGAIQIADGFSLVEVPELLADDIVRAMKQANLRGKKAIVRRDRDA